VSLVVPALTAVLGVALGYLAAQRREVWIRRLNSRQDFFQHALSLVDLMLDGADPPAEFIWGKVDAAGKAAYDAEFFGAGPEEVQRMQAVAVSLGRIATQRPPDRDSLAGLRDEVRSIRG